LSVGATLAPGFGALGAFTNAAGGLSAQFYNTFGIPPFPVLILLAQVTLGSILLSICRATQSRILSMFDPYKHCFRRSIPCILDCIPAAGGCGLAARPRKQGTITQIGSRRRRHMLFRFYVGVVCLPFKFVTIRGLSY
jgi:hypothetical protein